MHFYEMYFVKNDEIKMLNQSTIMFYHLPCDAYKYIVFCLILANVYGTTIEFYTCFMIVGV